MAAAKMVDPVILNYQLTSAADAAGLADDFDDVDDFDDEEEVMPPASSAPPPPPPGFAVRDPFTVFPHTTASQGHGAVCLCRRQGWRASSQRGLECFWIYRYLYLAHAFNVNLFIFILLYLYIKFSVPVLSPPGRYGNCA
jgi:hypothetical protein